MTTAEKTLKWWNDYLEQNKTYPLVAEIEAQLNMAVDNEKQVKNIDVIHCCKSDSELLKAFEIGDEVVCWENTFAKVIEVRLTGYVCEDLNGFTFMVDNKDVKHKSL